MAVLQGVPLGEDWDDFPVMYGGVMFLSSLILSWTFWAACMKRRAHGPSKTQESLPPERSRSVVAFGCAAAFVSLWARSVMSVAVLSLAEEFSLDSSTCALALSCFFYGYLASNLLATVAVRRFRPGSLLLASMLLSSAATLLLPASLAFGGAEGLLACRVLGGLVQGMLYPSVYGIFAAEFPADEGARTRAGALLGSMGPLGVAANFLLSPLIIGRWGWRLAVAAPGLLFLPWCLLWACSPSRQAAPRQVSGATADKKDGADLEGVPPDAADAAPSGATVREVLRAGPFYGIAAGHFAHNWTHFVVLAWLPTYLSKELGISGDSLAISCLPYLATALASPCGGAVSSWLLQRRGWSLWRVRQTLGLVGLLGPALGAALFPHVPASLWPLALLVIASMLALSTFVFSSVLAGPLDIAGPKTSGMLFSMSNSLSATSGFWGVEATDLLREHFGWQAAFGSCTVLYLLAAAVWIRLGSVNRIFD